LRRFMSSPSGTGKRAANGRALHVIAIILMKG